MCGAQQIIIIVDKPENNNNKRYLFLAFFDMLKYRLHRSGNRKTKNDHLINAPIKSTINRQINFLEEQDLLNETTIYMPKATILVNASSNIKILLKPYITGDKEINSREKIPDLILNIVFPAR